MRKIDKGVGPQLLTRFKAKHPAKSYNDLDHAARAAIRQTCTAEQLHLCAYCCVQISGERGDTLNEHLLSRDHHPQLSLAFENIVASCNTPGQCDAAKGNRFAPLSPLMSECEEELRFLVSGRVEGLSQRAVDTIEVLNLGDHENSNKRLVEKRRELSRMLLLVNGVDPASPVEDDELLQMVLDDLNRPYQGKLESFAPVVANILKGWLSV